MKQSDVIRFFDRAAPTWDAEMICSAPIVASILDTAQVSAGKTVLDVACGTGILIPWYLRRQVQSVTAVDISPEMVRLCREKFPQPEVEILCADAEALSAGRLFDCVMVYNAFPHFPDPERLVQKLSTFVAPGGTLTIAHGMGRAEIDRRHHGPARHVSRPLPPVEELAVWMGRSLTVTAAISNDSMYQITGQKAL